MQKVPLENQRLSFSINETVASTGLGRSSIYEAIREGRLRARKVGRRTVVLAADLNDFLASLPALYVE